MPPFLSKIFEPKTNLSVLRKVVHTFKTFSRLNMRKVLLGILLIFLSFPFLYAQKDSITFSNGDVIVGEVKKLDRNILKVETDYSDEDFKIEWNGVKEIYTETFFLITLSRGSRYNGKLRSMNDGYISIIMYDSTTVNVKHDSIVMLDDIEPGFWSQLDASIDVGIDVTKANNLRQFSIRSNIGYLAKHWQLDGNYNILQSRQDETDPIKRTDGSATFRYFLPHDWYPMVSAEFLSNTEQQDRKSVV